MSTASLIFLIFIGFLNRPALSAPHPSVGSSVLNQVQNSIIFSQLGFELKQVPYNWELKKPLETSLFEIGPQTEERSILSFKQESIKDSTNLERYVRQYLRDYNQYGFEVTGLQSLAKTGNNTVVVDLTQKNKTVKSRQVFYKNGPHVLVATCVDHFEQFDQSLLLCNQILNSLNWRQK